MGKMEGKEGVRERKFGRVIGMLVIFIVIDCFMAVGICQIVKGYP